MHLRRRPWCAVLFLAAIALFVAAAAEASPRRRLVSRLGSAEAQWIRARSVVVETTDAAASTTDLLPLVPFLADAEVITLGEGTHYTHEFQTMLHRLTRLLAEELGARLFTFEGPWPDFRDLDDYLRTGVGDPAAILEDENWKFWETEEMLALARWARGWNEAHPQEEWISFAGVDPLFPGRLRDDVVAFLRSVDPAAASAAETAYACLLASGAPPENGCREKLETVLAALAAKQTPYEQASSVRAFERAHWSARMMLGAEYVASAPDNRERQNRRDEILASNVLALRAESGRGRPVAWRGHNMHASADGSQHEDGRRYESVGRALRNELGSALFAIGSTTSRGTYLAYGAPTAGLSVFPIPDPPPGSWERLFEEAGYPAVVVTLRAPRPQWTEVERPFFSYVGNLRFEEPDVYAPPMVLPAMFDAVIYVRETTPTQPLR